MVGNSFRSETCYNCRYLRIPPWYYPRPKVHWSNVSHFRRFVTIVSASRALDTMRCDQWAAINMTTEREYWYRCTASSTLCGSEFLIPRSVRARVHISCSNAACSTSVCYELRQIPRHIIKRDEHFPAVFPDFSAVSSRGGNACKGPDF
jgi:hypothetical protein